MTTVSIAAGPTDATVRRSLLAALVAMFLGAVTGIGFFTVGGVFAPLSDAASVAIGLSLIPVALGLERHFSTAGASRARRAKLTGVVGNGLFALGGFVLVLYHTVFGWLPEVAAFGVQFLGIVVQGVWLVMVGLLALRTGIFERRIGRAAATAGGAYLLMCAVFPIDPGGPLVVASALVAVAAFFAWAIWTRAALQPARG